MSRYLFGFLVLLGCTSCGFGLGPETGSVHDFTVRRYEDVNGHEDVIDPNNLGLTYFMETKGDAKHGALGINCLINHTLDMDLRLVNVIIHELENGLVLGDGNGYTPEWPTELDGTWLLWDSDDPFKEIGPDEAAWLGLHMGNDVNVQSRDEWMLDAIREACWKINAAAGVVVFEVP